MKTRFVMFSMLAAIAIFAANSFAANNNAAAKEVKSEKVDQDVKPKAMMWVGFNNQTGDGNHSGTMQVNVQTMNMTFEALAYEWARAAQVTGTYKNYKYYITPEVSSLIWEENVQNRVLVPAQPSR